MQEHYDHKTIESKTQEIWSSKEIYKAIEYSKNIYGSIKPKFYACSMLPYPSGKLHMGHVRNYTINDVMARYKRMNGFNVLMPMGWDAFGMPAENAAIKSKISPAEWTYKNIKYMKSQMQSIGLSIDWSREICACDPEYYKWTQWLFLKMLENNIVYQNTQIVNWDPVDQTVLANEQVIDGHGWRSGALIEKREIPGYYLRITDYADELLSDLDNKLQEWPEKVKIMQSNWIGKSEGLRFAFKHNIRDKNNNLIQNGNLYVFTTRPDTINGITFCGIAPEHPISIHLSQNNKTIQNFIDQTKIGTNTEAEISTKEKKGIFTGLSVNNPITNEEIPIWICNYVLMSYGDGAIMGVPAHDERDFEFAKKYGIPIKQVISNKNFEASNTSEWKEPYRETKDCYLINSGIYNNLDCKSAAIAISKEIIKKKIGDYKTTWRLRDWSISRQRYWGTPIPIIHCPNCGSLPVPYDQLPVKLPENLTPDGNGNPLNKDNNFVHCICHKCSSNAKRETDTMDTFIDSSWYFMRYTSANNKNEAIDERNNYWMPIDQYIGGIEHAVLHLLYARFWTKVMRDMKMLSFDEPITRLLCQGMVLNHSFSVRTKNGGIEYFNPDDVEAVRDSNNVIVSYKLINSEKFVEYNGIGTMSKSKNNGVDPQSIINNWGADTARLFIIFASPPEQTLEWSNSGIEGANRFLRKLWRICYTHKEYIISSNSNNKRDIISLNNKKSLMDLRRDIHSLLKQCNHDYERLQYNTIVSASMKMLKSIEYFCKQESTILDNNSISVLTEAIGILLRILYPIVPHITYVIWENLNYNLVHGNIIDSTWPTHEEEALISEKIKIIIQINGKLRGSFFASTNENEEKLKNIAIKTESVSKYILNKNIKRIIVVPNKLINIVLND
ncbi:leucyl-tRNA synthetase [Candidatus Kinetoplastibacterium desouzaii TCC079E]|uniref:Leucine--tRNA ligase n=1 Tax=Candidatus Kinetoplastidibacterium desouzai TCC079E TaxID=1208919 RepID=M1LTW1_9PROT|nr:leucine--tRNA ligase [Candidatus Kinetoplastibacterium desouzaii]AGF46729.1 leucyl-tRNA synthetase [Candidatus Kinetoplastibacterium desouzaii TCC079E]